MPLALHNITPPQSSKRQRRRVGRGLASKGSYSGRGVKGQRARSGGRSGLQLKGLRSLMLKIPKQRGFRGLKDKPEIVNLGQLTNLFAEGSIVTPQELFKKGLVRRTVAGVKILGNGEINQRLIVKECFVSRSAEEKIKKAGGEIVVK